MVTKRWFIFKGEELLLQNKDGQLILPEITISNRKPYFIGELDGCTYYVILEDDVEVSLSDHIPVNLWESRRYLQKDLYHLAGKAYEVLYWDKNSQYCSACGTHTIQVTEISKLCPVCKKEIFPHITSAVLALVKKEDEILLVHAHTFNHQFYSIVAGFVEIGESLEECVCREVKEETGLEITNVTYFGSQSWPFPSGMMIGFVADYLSGNICLQEDELSDGRFYSRNNLPDLPPCGSLSREMIDWWIKSVE